jgi:hypothetical protein
MGTGGGGPGDELDIPIITDEEANEIYLKMTLQS